jgi:hypothetical protein
MAAHDYFDEMLERNAALSAENVRLQARVEELEELEPWALYGIWHASFEPGPHGDAARDLWLRIIGPSIEGRS